ncbi:putative ras-related protein Rab-31 [Triplophysa rosa]|uniref:Ras-related protein Rab-31 n=1 Tax=Triplophysa rosa TaxID=992332 RepID=A0A9W8C7Q2_TRIRA|nr:putative ras-related protein Rab-31 [Triplophysa rosa]
MAIRELKVCLLGDTGVGKSSIVCRFVQDHFDHNISPTIGASFLTKTVPCGNELHKFLIWDTAGQERFHSLAPMYYRGSAAAVIVYDITKLLPRFGPIGVFVISLQGNHLTVHYSTAKMPLQSSKQVFEAAGASGVPKTSRCRQIPPLEGTDAESNESFKLTRQTPPSTKRCC